MPVNQFLVLGVVPANNEQQVPVNTDITVSFAKHMDVNTLTEANLKLRKVNGQYIPYTQSYSHDTYRLILTPSTLLEGNTQYQVEIVGGTEGVKSVTGDWTSTRTYEFSTVLTKAISQPQNLRLSQEGSRISAIWNAPSIVNELETISYDIRVSASSDSDSPYLWPELPIGTEYNVTITTLLINNEFETGRNYYVHVRAVSESDTSDWTTAQIYLEPPVTEQPSNPDNPDSPVPIVDQIEALEIYPSQGSVIEGNMILVAFSDNLDNVLPINAMYVVEAPYKAQLSTIDLLTKYSPAKAVSGTVSLTEGNENVLQWVATEDLPTEKEYVVIISKDIKGLNTDSLGVPFVHAFRSPWARLYGDIQSIKEKLGDLAQSVSDASIYSSMHVNTLFAYDTVSVTGTFAPAEYTSTDAPYYVHQYVNLQTAYDVLINGIANSGGASEESFTLGQLQVSKQMDTTSAMSLLSTLKSEIKPWLDRVHGLNNRGYAKPGGAVKGENAQPYPDFLTRSELKTNFDV